MVTNELYTPDMNSVTYQPLIINVGIHCPLTQQTTIKGESTRNLRYTQLHNNNLQNLSQLIFSLESFSLPALSFGGGLADTTPACYSFPLFIFAGFSPTETTPFIASSIRYDMIFCIIKHHCYSIFLWNELLKLVFFFFF